MKKTILATAILLAFSRGGAFATEVTYDGTAKAGSVEENTIVNVNTVTDTGSAYALADVDGSEVAKGVTLTINTSGQTSHFIGVRADTDLTYTNNGTIEVNNENVSNYWKVKAMVANGGRVENQNTIRVTNAYAMQTTAGAGGEIINSGRIEVNGVGAAFDIDTQNKNAKATNKGTIVLNGNNAAGVLLGQGDSFTNSGKIVGKDGYAVVVTEKDSDAQGSAHITLTGNSVVEGLFALTKDANLTVEGGAIHQTVRLVGAAGTITNNSALTIEQGTENALDINKIVSNGATTDVLLNSVGTAQKKVLTVAQTDGAVGVAYSGAVADQIQQGGVDLDNLLNGVSIEGSSITETSVREGQWGNGMDVALVGDKAVVTRTSENSLLRSAKDVALTHAVVWRSELTSLSDRMGTLRTLPNSAGAWARYTGGNLEGDTVDYDFNSVEVGFDARVTDTMSIGASFGYTFGDTDLAAGEAENDSYKLGLYASYFNEAGSFLDMMLKVGRIDAEFNLNNGYAEKGDYMYTGVIAGVEVGHRFKLSSFFVEPQVQVSYSYLAAETTVTNVRTIELDSMKSLIARVGVMGGMNFAQDRGAAYVSAHYNHDFLGDVEGSFYDNGTNNVGFAEELDDNWGVVSLGANYHFTDSVNGFVDLSRSFGGDIEEKWRVNLGARYVF